MRPWLTAAVLLLLCGSFASPSSRRQRRQGAELFVSSGCQHCHTIGGVGGHRGPNLSNIGRTKSKTEIRSQIIGGSKIMPSFRDSLDPAEIADLVAYLHSCRHKPPAQ